MTPKDHEVYVKNLVILNLSILGLTSFTAICVAIMIYYSGV